MTTTTTSPTGPAPLAGQVRAGVAALLSGAPGTGAGGWTGEEREAVVAELDAAIQELTVYRGQILLAHRNDGRWGSVQDRDFADYRSRSTGIGRGAALGDLRLAEGLEAMPAVAEAVERGEVTLEHARALTRLREKASPEVQDALAGGGLDTLLERATRRGLTAPELGKEARAGAARVAAAAARAEFEAVRRRRSLTMRKHAGGVAGEFFLDPVAGDELRIALEAITGRPAADDDRTREQRMADALSTMASRTLQVGSDLNGAQVRPHLAVLVPGATWVGILARRRTFATCPDGPRPPWPDVPPGQLEDGTVVPLGELERLMCDSEMTRMVMDAAGVPLDVGRTQRTYSKELRRAITTRDRHCMWPGCRRRASWSEVHHITWFSRGGRTSLAEGITLCSYHHHRVHEFDVVITTLPDGFDFHHRDGRHIGTSARGDPGPLLPDAPGVAPSPAAPQAGEVTAGPPGGRSADVRITSPPPAAKGGGAVATIRGAPPPRPLSPAVAQPLWDAHLPS
ncbi:DUF222 domain-containing protein [Georgenia sp. Marseille-Q6866]